MKSLRGRDFLSVADFTSEELRFVIDTAYQLKQRFYAGERVIPVLKGKTLLMIFQKPSTRTRVSFEQAMVQLGGHVMSFNWQELQLGRGETIADTARVLSRYVDGIVARVYKHSDLIELAKYAEIPVINALSDKEHPCQAVGDMLTILEKKGRLKGITLAYVGDGGNNVAHSLILAASKLGVNVRVGTAEGYDPDPDIVKLAEAEAKLNGSYIEIVRKPEEAVKGVDVVYTDVWVSMGQEAEKEKRERDLGKFRVTPELMKLAKEDAIFMHCLPAHRGLEVVDEVIDGPWSVVWDQAENRLHAQKAILALLL
ncbi:MAG: ornithine carbamoyltransferase [Zestosphaera tikiterensis]|uniref:Ornithine carbamoyltransferase n=1 Tax=Zestosphaera tikiterensis TaxID=1973259 RepID=A0A2R7Y700_9CREN|nr:MAG: ornithine carbamoyltransferase [Zestosphaera tikiterensis]